MIGTAELIADLFEIRQDPPPPFQVDGGQRFVEEQQLGAGHQRAGEGDALALAARQLANVADRSSSAISSIAATAGRSSRCPGRRP